MIDTFKDNKIIYNYISFANNLIIDILSKGLQSPFLTGEMLFLSIRLLYKSKQDLALMHTTAICRPYLRLCIDSFLHWRFVLHYLQSPIFPLKQMSF